MNKIKKIVDDKPAQTQQGFVSRWSQHKYESSKAFNHLTAENAPITNQSVLSKSIENQSSEDIPVAIVISEDKQTTEKNSLTDKDMPDINSLTDDSDYTDFLSPGVSDGLRKLALQKLFHSEVFNICDGLDDYDDDYTQFKKLGDIVTSDMRHQIELTAQRLQEKLITDELDENRLLVDVNHNDSLNESIANTDISIDRNIDFKNSDDDIELLIPDQQIKHTSAVNENVVNKTGVNDAGVGEAAVDAPALTLSSVKTDKHNNS